MSFSQQRVTIIMAYIGQVNNKCLVRWSGASVDRTSDHEHRLILLWESF